MKCIACSGTGVSSRGGPCIPCCGSGIAGIRSVPSERQLTLFGDDDPPRPAPKAEISPPSDRLRTIAQESDPIAHAANVADDRRQAVAGPSRDFDPRKYAAAKGRSAR